jgi:pyridoxamine 5'-phosphate oxidase
LVITLVAACQQAFCGESAQRARRLLRIDQLPTSPARCQFRLRGAVLTLPAAVELEERQRHWDGLPPAGRALWGWPEPGAVLDSAAAFPAELADDTPLPAHFQLLRIALEQVELLELRDHPHQRRRWRRDGGWSEECLNP